MEEQYLDFLINLVGRFSERHSRYLTGLVGNRNSNHFCPFCSEIWVAAGE